MKTVYLILGIMTLVVSNVNGQNNVPPTAKQYTVSEIKTDASKLDKADSTVQIRGYIVERIDNETFWFKDNTGKIQIEFEDDQLPDFSFDEKTELIIIGEVDYDLLEETEIEVEYVQLATNK